MELDPEGLEAVRKVLGDNAHVLNARETAALVIRAYEAHQQSARARILQEAKVAAESAQLESGMQWGTDAMEQFNYGKRRAAAAIEDLK